MIAARYLSGGGREPKRERGRWTRGKRREKERERERRRKEEEGERESLRERMTSEGKALPSKKVTKLGAKCGEREGRRRKKIVDLCPCGEPLYEAFFSFFFLTWW